MKRLIKLFVLLGVLALLVIAYLVFMLVRSANEEDDYTNDGIPPIMTTYTAAQIDINTMYALSFSTSTDEYCFELNSAGNAWVWTDDTALPLDNTYFANMASALQEVTTATKLKISASELASYGLDAPWLSITVSDDTHGIQTFSFGSSASSEKYYFSSSSTSDCVYTVDASVASPFGFTPYQMVKNDTLPTIDSDRIQRIEFNSSNDVTTYTYYDGGKDELSDTDDYWYVTVNSGDEEPVDSETAEIIGSVYSTVAFSTPAGYSESHKKELGLDEATVMTIYYSERKTITDSTTGTSATVTVDKSFSLLLGYLDSQNALYVCLPDSVLSYSIDASILSKLYSAVSKAS